MVCGNLNMTGRNAGQKLLAVALVNNSAVQDHHNTGVGLGAHQSTESLLELENGRRELIIEKGIAALVTDLFQGRQGRTVERLQILALDMSSQKASVPLAMVQEISPRVARAYAGKTRKTVLRDLGELEKLELIEKTPEGYRARRELLVSCLG